ncbi:phthiocerol/phthiodiolone dimycocerosyl transferase family protein [Nocardia rhizosphaerae]|uniref:Phthiocerol/phthiodiolone dimycocerosyl transferase n=1 Tax=Nocardia rhizosphaerae TaxID=1691571 RepID=A0ABV8L3V3_9NOCA
MTVRMRGEVRRELSAGERWFWLIDQLSPANCVVRIRVRGAIGAYRLEEAAAALVAEFPLLRAVVREGPRFEPSADPHLPVVHRVVDGTQEWREVFDEQLNEPVDLATAPGRIIDLAWRPATSAEFHDVIVVFSHVLIDGRSLASLASRLLANAVGAAPGAGARPPILPADAMIPPRYTGVVPCLRANLAGQLGALGRRALGIPGEPPPLPVRRTRTVHRTIDGAELVALRDRCRTEDVTVNSALVAALATAMGELFRPGGTGFAGIGIPVDVRSRLRPAPAADEPGMFTAVVPTFVPFGRRRSVHDAAWAVKSQLSRHIHRGTDLSALAAIRYGCPRTLESGKRAIELVDRRAPWNITLSNLGRLATPETPEPLRITALTVAGTNSCASAMTVAVATHGDTLSITFCYVDTLVPHSAIELLADRTVASVLRW